MYLKAGVFDTLAVLVLFPFNFSFDLVGLLAPAVLGTVGFFAAMFFFECLEMTDGVRDLFVSVVKLLDGVNVLLIS